MSCRKILRTKMKELKVTARKNQIRLPLQREENLDEEISLAAQNMPSSLGFTFLVSSDPAAAEMRGYICNLQKSDDA